MKHCVNFQPYDIWFLDDTASFVSRKLLLGFCPRCSKPLLELHQKNIGDNTVSVIRKVGLHAHILAESLKHQVSYSLAECNALKFKPANSGWVFGVNKEYKLKNGNIISKQFAADFFGNKVLVKKRTLYSG